MEPPTVGMGVGDVSPPQLVRSRQPSHRQTQRSIHPVILESIRSLGSTDYVTESSLELLFFWLLPRQCWHSWPAPPCLVMFNFLKNHYINCLFIIAIFVGSCGFWFVFPWWRQAFNFQFSSRYFHLFSFDLWAILANFCVLNLGHMWISSCSRTVCWRGDQFFTEFSDRNQLLLDLRFYSVQLGLLHWPDLEP